MPEPDAGRPLAQDPDAVSARPGLPAFLARPDHQPVYYGFPVLDDVTVDGFTLGKISDFEAEEMDDGDAFVIAPDGRRAGLVWEVGDEARVSEIRPPDAGRWGVYGARFTGPMRTRDDARRNLAEIVGPLRAIWLRSRSAGDP